MAALRALLLLGLAACGDRLFAEDYRGEPLATFPGEATPRDMDLRGEAGVTLAMFWSSDGAADPPSLVEDTATAMPIVAPQAFTLHLFQPPPHAARARAGDAEYAIGRVLAYQEDAGGRTFVGAEPPRLTAWASAPIAAERSPTGRPLPAGFSRLQLPQLCGGPVPGPREPGTCGVELGKPCRGNEECPGGSCVNFFVIPFPNGACVMPEPPPAECRPADAAYWPTGPVSEGDGVWVKACESDADCAREGDPVGAYACDPGIGGCLPQGPVFLELSRDLRLMPFCAGDPGYPPPRADQGGQACETSDDCLGACPEGAFGCECRNSPQGLACVMTCRTTEDCLDPNLLCDPGAHTCNPPPQ